ncbi:NADH-ubiquinone oxidoreductase chain 4L [Geobacter metallireducens RCH3]|uniref:NADH-quinone oxidoreductase subunit K 2 n=1 Tax=Geobacter metallireducens (strain ATCC 53774 / DSM 7210 / GS-15) TaxID=269799 RepID=NUOK2_GEOMG|nr:NADH-quinone oxidoreductase subunit NuoK [Geobacter metallireducens]Q39QB7.1 RecName: Full=NADH-quinone oxidoreductase subunit K 2; AltName: Full=NADH dehydrogenase I subunit K 2; AltName: Full=NDH-1 subunit K 2 [Geobacter metallireducens GS-15]ABB33557.1 NADH dehydrogenase I, K subunit [Geobacter metallireducens GS-15]EHP87667.1 NADH-ubiquinone oxidoreductase chain 4L [Geobacter metallireducens RCH3]
MVSLHSYLILSAILFSIGTIGVLIRRNAIVIFMCVEMMLNSVNLTFIALSKHLGNVDGQIFVFFVMTVAAAEAAVGLALMIAFYKNRESIDVEDIKLMRL